MAETIEVAKTGRAKCRGCRQAIEKGALRFGEEQPSAFTEGMQWVWYHLPCAAGKRPVPFRTALAAYAGEVPDRAALEGTLASAEAKVVTYPYAERAPTGRAKCIACEETIAKGELRLAIEREVEAGGMTRTGAGYLHPACAAEHLEEEDLFAKVSANSKALSAEDFALLAQAFG